MSLSWLSEQSKKRKKHFNRRKKAIAKKHMQIKITLKEEKKKAMKRNKDFRSKLGYKGNKTKKKSLVSKKIGSLAVTSMAVNRLGRLTTHVAHIWPKTRETQTM